MDRHSSIPFRSHLLRPIASIIERCKAFFGKFAKKTVVQVPNQKEKQQNWSFVIERTWKAAARLDLEQGALDQVQCQLLSMLSADVRLMIYDYILCSPGPVVHIVARRDGNLGTCAPSLISSQTEMSRVRSAHRFSISDVVFSIAFGENTNTDSPGLS